jgi:hypothetical protein
MSRAARKGQFRILEVVFAAVILTSAYSVAIFIMEPANNPAIRASDDLEILAFNVLNHMAQGGTFDRITTEVGWEESIKIAMTRLMPPGTYFNMTVFNATISGPSAVLIPINSSPITNVQALEAVTAFGRSPEISSSTLIYTTKDGQFLVLRIIVAAAGGIS